MKKTNEFNFDKFNEQGLKAMLRQLEREGLELAKDGNRYLVDATNKPRREMGYLVKTATIHTESGQKIMVKAKADGSIYQIKLNGKVLALRNTEDLDAALQEVATLVDRNEDKFLKNRESRLKKLKAETAPVPKPAKTSMKAQIDVLEGNLASHRKTNEAIQAQLDDFGDALEEKRERIRALEGDIETEEQTMERLQSELDELSAAAQGETNEPD